MSRNALGNNEMARADGAGLTAHIAWLQERRLAPAKRVPYYALGGPLPAVQGHAATRDVAGRAAGILVCTHGTKRPIAGAPVSDSRAVDPGGGERMCREDANPGQCPGVREKATHRKTWRRESGGLPPPPMPARSHGEVLSACRRQPCVAAMLCAGLVPTAGIQGRQALTGPYNTPGNRQMPPRVTGRCLRPSGSL